MNDLKGKANDVFTGCVDSDHTAGKQMYIATSRPLLSSKMLWSLPLLVTWNGQTKSKVQQLTCTVNLQHKEPRGPRPVCDLLLEKLATAEAEVSQLVPDSAQNSGRNDKNNRSNASNRYAQCLQCCTSYRAQQ